MSAISTRKHDATIHAARKDAAPFGTTRPGFAVMWGLFKAHPGLNWTVYQSAFTTAIDIAIWDQERCTPSR